MRFTITSYAGPGSANLPRDPSVMIYDTAEDGAVEEILRKIGLEYKTADYFHDRQLVLVIDPVEPDAGSLKELLSKTVDMVDDLKEFLTEQS